MDISQQIEAVYRRALLLRQYAVESPVPHDLLGKALQELYFVLEELQTSQEELHQQNQALITAQQTLGLEHQRYEALFDLAPNGYLVTDRQGIIEEVNHAAAALFSTPPAFLIHKPLLVLVHPSDRTRFQAQLANLTSGQNWEVILNPRHGVLITVAIAVTRFQDPRLRKEMLLWSLHDITQRQQMELQLQVAHDALQARVAEHTANLAEANSQPKQELEEIQRAEQIKRD